jgi:hypothetical protein
MRKRWVLAAAAVLTAGTIIGVVAVASSANQAAQDAQDPQVNTAKVEQGSLSATVSRYGTLGYRAQPDGTPYSVINQARGTYTTLPEAGDRVDCGKVFYRVDDNPVLLLCGTVPAYRGLRSGDMGNDVRQLNRNLHTLGYDATAGVAINPDDNTFTGQTQKALGVLQHDVGAAVTGTLGIDGAVFLPESVRIAKVTGELGGPAQPGAQVLSATSDTLEVEVNLDASQQGDVKPGDRAQITLPGNVAVAGRVDRLGRVAQVPAGQNQDVAAATIPAYISLDDPEKAAGLDQSPVQVEITTTGVENALSVPLTAIVGRSGGGFAVEVVRPGGQHELVAVELGLVDSGDGRVQVTGDLRAGDDVVVPST